MSSPNASIAPWDAYNSGTISYREAYEMIKARRRQRTGERRFHVDAYSRAHVLSKLHETERVQESTSAKAHAVLAGVSQTTAASSPAILIQSARVGAERPSLDLTGDGIYNSSRSVGSGGDLYASNSKYTTQKSSACNAGGLGLFSPSPAKAGNPVSSAASPSVHDSTRKSVYDTNRTSASKVSQSSVSSYVTSSGSKRVEVPISATFSYAARSNEGLFQECAAVGLTKPNGSIFNKKKDRKEMIQALSFHHASTGLEQESGVFDTQKQLLSNSSDVNPGKTFDV